MFYIAVALIGIYAFSRIGVDLLPEINIPHLLVQTTYPDASAEEIEKLITEPLESAARTVKGIKNVSSVSKEGLSVISLDFVWGTNMDFALLSLREKLDNVRFILPRDAARPTIVRVDPSATPIMTLSLSARSFTPIPFSKGREAEHSPVAKIQFVGKSSPEYEIKKLIELKEAARVIFKRRLEQIDGVAQVIITGGLEREILVEVDLQKLEGYNLKFSDLTAALKSSNVNLPAGSLLKGLFRYSLRTLGEYQNVDEIAQTIVKRNSDGSVILLKDVAYIKESFKERNGITRFNGSETVGLLVNKEPESNSVNIAEKVKDAVQVLQKEYPEYNIQIVSDYSKFITSAIENVKQEIFYGGILAVLVLFFFLKSIRNIFIIGVTIPSSLAITVLMMYLFDISFNIISLGGIAVGVGMLLDNSIIVIENVTRYREMGLSIREAALRGSNEVSMPIVASTLTTIAVFFPLIFMKGITGELFKEQSYAVIFSLTSSIITAITLIPMLASRNKIRVRFFNRIIQDDKYLYIHLPNKGRFSLIFYWIKFPVIFIIKSIFYVIIFISKKISQLFNKGFTVFFASVDIFMLKVIDNYDKLLLWSLKNRQKILALLLLLFIITSFAILDIKKEFIPEAEEDELRVELIFSSGTSLEGNAYITSEIEDAILKIDGVESIISNIGRVNEFDVINREQNTVNKTTLLIKLNSYRKFYRVREKIQKLLKNSKVDNYNFMHNETAYSQVINPTKNDLAIVIKNKDIDLAFEKANQLYNKINNIKGIAELRLGIEKGEPEYKILINREKCIAYGVNIVDVSNQIVNIVKGNEATFFSDFDKKIAIRLKPIENQRNDLNKILESSVNSVSISVPIKHLITYQLTQSYNEIWRENQMRAVYLFARVSGANIDDVVSEINNIIQTTASMPGELIYISGLNQEIKDSLSNLYIALIIAILLMYMVLASEFESFLFPFIIIFSVPLGLIGSILLLYVFGESINIISVMGLIILVGIADNDAVVKVEFIMRKRKEGLSLENAILEAGRDRFRPIVMNSFTVIFALIPMMIGIGAATQLRASLSIALAGGLITATFLTLIIIPVLYSYFEKYSGKNFDVL
ncbi:efflux RND transporter permease subunit [Ignavibacterium album]|nr:efflux RND transporter permease subunit [Ignavibacterium album]